MPEIRYAASGRALLAAKVIGEGPRMVFLHSNAGDLREWRGVMGRSESSHRLTVYDRRGFGETRAEREDHSASADLLASLDALTDGAPAVLLGCSMGGKLALDATLRHSARFHGLVAPSVASAPPPAPGVGDRDRERQRPALVVQARRVAGRRCGTLKPQNQGQGQRPFKALARG